MNEAKLAENKIKRISGGSMQAGISACNEAPD